MNILVKVFLTILIVQSFISLLDGGRVIRYKRCKPPPRGATSRPVKPRNYVNVSVEIDLYLINIHILKLYLKIMMLV